jgi:hypothetical protein
MGRKRLDQKDPSFTARLIDTYMHTGSEAETAKTLGCGERTVRNYLHELEIYPPRGRRRGQYHRAAYRGAFVRWLREHPGVKLPESIEDIQELTGCSYEEIASHLKRLDRAIRREISALPDLRTLDVVMSDVREIPIPFRAIASYEIQSKRHSREVRIIATLRGGGSRQFTFHTHLDFLWEVIPKGELALEGAPREATPPEAHSG